MSVAVFWSGLLLSPLSQPREWWGGTRNAGGMLCGPSSTLHICYLGLAPLCTFVILLWQLTNIFFSCYYRKNIREIWSWKSKEEVWMPWPMKLPTSWEPGMLQILPARWVFHVSLSKKKKTNQKNSCDCKNTAFSFCYLTCWSDAYNGMVESVLMKGSRTFARAALICPSSSSSKNNQCFTILIISLLLLSQTLHNISHPTHSPINQTESQGLNFLSESHCLA